jgi:hypothetical protein
MTTSTQSRRLGRRTTHSSRSTTAIIVAVVVILASAYAGVEIVLAWLGLAPLLAAPADMARSLGELGTVPAVWTIVAGAVVVVLGLVVIAFAVRPGRRHRHLLPSERSTVVVDDRVIASAVARHAATAAGTGPDATVVSVDRRSATVRVTPTSGVMVDQDEVRAAVDEQLEQYRVTPSLRGRVRIARTGEVGA